MNVSHRNYGFLIYPEKLEDLAYWADVDHGELERSSGCHSEAGSVLAGSPQPLPLLHWAHLICFCPLAFGFAVPGRSYLLINQTDNSIPAVLPTNLRYTVYLSRSGLFFKIYLWFFLHPRSWVVDFFSGFIILCCLNQTDLFFGLGPGILKRRKVWV